MDVMNYIVMVFAIFQLVQAFMKLIVLHGDQKVLSLKSLKHNLLAGVPN
jgi:hypothetical protein